MRSRFRRSWWIGCLALIFPGFNAQTDVVFHWVHADGEPVEGGEVLRVGAWIDGVSRQAIQGPELLVDDEGLIRWPAVEDGVYTLEWLPWAWTILVEASCSQQGRDTIELVIPIRKTRSLRGNEAPVKYREDHPASTLASFNDFAQSMLDTLNVDQLLALGAVGGGGPEVEEAKRRLALATSRLDLRVEEDQHRFVAFSMWEDLWKEALVELQLGLGISAPVAGKLQREGDPRDWTERLKSPGWCSGWRWERERWWDSENMRTLPWRHWVSTGQSDSLLAHTSWSLEELHLAMWLGVEESWSTEALQWWNVRWRDQCVVAEMRRISDQAASYLLTGQSWADKFWMTPSRTLEPGWSGQGQWMVWLVVKEGSASSLREWSTWRDFTAKEPLPGVEWGILSVDATEEEWNQTLSHRTSTKELLRWVGRDPSWWDRLDILGLPQVILIRPDGTVDSHHAPLPSEGLRTHVKFRTSAGNSGPTRMR
ncbi:MAG: hypothetical protein O3B70_02785 [Bacteroidetes bacterium]|nr:hypothetical protein [Bacteroidota bacterium]MDA0903235.1 hypothetical protein [Bacteroidota bacterium]MDA1242206.1 hypothetical protein [Bacteroidota bacterium]